MGRFMAACNDCEWKLVRLGSVNGGATRNKEVDMTDRELLMTLLEKELFDHEMRIMLIQRLPLRAKL